MSADLYIQDNAADNGTEPNATTTTFFDSPDIWLTNPNGNVVDNPVCGQHYTLHVRVHNRSAHTSSGASLSLRWRTCAASPCWRDGWFNTSPFHGSPTSGPIAQVSLGPIPAGQHAEYTVAWTAPSFQSNSYIPQAGDTQPLSICALLDDGNPVPGIDANARPMADFARQSNTVGLPVLAETVTPAADGTASCTLPLHGVPAGQYQLRLTAGTQLIDARTLVVR